MAILKSTTNVSVGRIYAARSVRVNAEEAALLDAFRRSTVEGRRMALTVAKDILTGVIGAFADLPPVRAMRAAEIATRPSPSLAHSRE